MNKPISLALLALAVMSASGNVSASPASSSTTSTSCGQAGGTCSENFQYSTTNLLWIPLNDACLTSNTALPPPTVGQTAIPQCGTTYSSIPVDTGGQGALMLTPPKTQQRGAILSNFTFPMSQGINITFTTYTFGGSGGTSSSGGTAKNGADGLAFMLSNGAYTPTVAGGTGGSLGYSCSNNTGNTVDGLANAYLGLGVDEYGNFLNSGNWVKAGSGGSAPSGAAVPNIKETVSGTTYYWVPGDNGSAGIFNSNDTFNSEGSTAYGTNSYGGTSSSQYQPERIGLRGAGNTNWTALNALNSSYYSGSTENTTKVAAACNSGQYVSGGSGTNSSPYTYTALPAGNYNAIPGGYAVLPGALCTPSSSNTATCLASGYTVGSQPIANNSTSATRNPTSSTTTANTAWPITYQLKITAGGLLSFSYSYNGGAMTPVLTNTNLTSINGAPPSSLRFGFSAGTGSDDNIHEITCFKASPLTSTSSAAANTIQSGQYKTGTQIYLASYSASPWWGSMEAIPLVVNSSGNLAAGNTATWDGKCTLTGGLCDSMGTSPTTGIPTTSVTALAPESRVLVTATGNDVTASASGGVGFSMQTALTKYPSAVQTAMAAGATADSTTTTPIITMTAQDALGWLLGQRCGEQLYSSAVSTSGPSDYSGDCSSYTPTPGNLNPRTYVLGDIIDSSPTWVGAPVVGQYNDVFTDDLYGSTVSPPENQSGAQTYGTFASNNATRTNVVYVGSNDGYLHGFEAGYFTTSGTFSDPSGTGIGSNDGKEVIGYMPYNVLLTQAAQLTNPLGAHQYMVDATPGAGDLFYNGVWHTWLVGGVGTGGKEIYALDVTNPGNIPGAIASSFSSTNAGSLVMGDWTNVTMSHLGNTVGTPSIVRMHNGQWAIIFGNGLNSGTSAGVYIGLVNSTTGAVTYLFLDTGVGSSTVKNGIAYVTPVDLDGDGIMDYLYAGDQQGNVWRFDVTSSSSTSWSVSNFPGSTASACSNNSNTSKGVPIATTCSPLFTATTNVSISGTTTTVSQPITTSIVTATIQTNGVSRNMLYFGTGQQTPQTSTAGTLYAPASIGSGAITQQQAFYGIWDWNMASWNSVSGTQFASQTGSQTISTASTSLQPITSTTTVVAGQGQVTGYRTLSAATIICWAGSSTCASGNTQYGWMYNLPSTNEQIIYSPAIIQGAVVVNTAIPPTASNTQCTANTQTGWSMAFDPTSGGALSQNLFSSINSAASGVQANAVGTFTSVTYNGQLYGASQTATNGAFIPRLTPPNDNSPARVSWREIRN